MNLVKSVPTVYLRCTYGDTKISFAYCRHFLLAVEKWILLKVYLRCTYGVPTVYLRCTYGDTKISFAYYRHLLLAVEIWIWLKVPTVYLRRTYGVRQTKILLIFRSNHSPGPDVRRTPPFPLSRGSKTGTAWKSKNEKLEQVKVGIHPSCLPLAWEEITALNWHRHK